MSALRWIAVLLALCAVSLAQTGVKITSRDTTALLAPKNAVRRYCEMDAQAFRLSADSAKRMQPVVAEQLSNEWHGFEVIADYQIGAAKANARGVVVTVTYTVLGRIEVGDGYTPDPRIDTIEVQTVPDGDDWKLLTDQLRIARVRRGYALKWVREQAGTEKDPYRKVALEQAIKALQ
jgi:hypothetical protein